MQLYRNQYRRRALEKTIIKTLANIVSDLQSLVETVLSTGPSMTSLPSPFSTEQEFSQFYFAIQAIPPNRGGFPLTPNRILELHRSVLHPLASKQTRRAPPKR